MVSGGAVRQRIYSVMGLAAMEIATLVGMVGFTFCIGLCFVLALVFIIAPAETASLLHIPAAVARLSDQYRHPFRQKPLLLARYHRLRGDHGM